jgi:hypothetical protein
MFNTPRIGLGLALAACIAGCSGNIGSGGGNPGKTGSAGPTGSTVSPGGTGGATGVPNQSMPSSPYLDSLSNALWRLTNAEYSQTVSDLLGEPADAAVRYSFPTDSLDHGFDNNVSLLQIATAHATQYAVAADAIVKAVFLSPTRQAKVVGCDVSMTSCLQTYIRALGRRMYRRPLSDQEVMGYATLAAGAVDPTNPTAPFQIVLQGMLQSPYFLFRVSLGASPPNQSTIVGLNGFELATRLSYLLWGTTPDDALLDQAQGGALDTPGGVAGVVQQMLMDPRSRNGTKSFYERWLPLRLIAGPAADTDRIPNGDTALATAMVQETSLFVDSVLWGGQPVANLLTAPYTFVNAQLAAIYQVPPPATGWQRINFPAGSSRAGVLTQGTLLAAGSHGTKISITRRGQLIREQLLCQDIPSPPPGVNANVPPPQPGETELQTIARHKTDPKCSSCHNLMDPLGIALSGFDQTGAARTKDSNGQPISTQGQLVGLTPPDFNGPVELAQKIASSTLFTDCVVRQLFRYSYGRSDDATDANGLTQMTTSFVTGNWDFIKGLTALVTSDAFRYRSKGDAP